MEINTNEAVTPKKRGRKPLPPGVKRLRKAVRLAPTTMEFLEGLYADNIGRSIDLVVDFLRDHASVTPQEVVSLYRKTIH